jgi:hypothetical protein
MIDEYIHTHTHTHTYIGVIVKGEEEGGGFFRVGLEEGAGVLDVGEGRGGTGGGRWLLIHGFLLVLVCAYVGACVCGDA